MVTKESGDQLELIDTTAITKREEESIEARFARFDALNPHVYRNLRKLAIAAVRGGAKRLGIKALYERLRWSYLETGRESGFKLPNEFTAHYARKLMREEPKLRGVFVVRRLRSRRGRK